MQSKRLFRKTHDRVIAGVCAGLAEYFNIDVVVVRLAAVIGIILTGFFPGVVLYVIAIIMIPNKPESKNDSLLQ